MTEIIVRLKCEIGLYRLEIDKNKKLIDLKKKIEEILNVPSEKQQLYLDEKPNVLLNNDFSILSECSIHNGSMILLKSEIKPNKKSNNNKDGANISNKEKDNSDYNEIRKKEAQKEVVSKGKDKDDKSDNKNESKSNFKSFDYFLKLRGYNTTDLPLNLTYKSIYLTKGKFIKIPLSITLKHQEYRHVDHLELMNVEEIKDFVHYWCYNNNMIEQRAGWMYGYYKEDSHYNLGIRAVCECIYEPPQINENNQVKFLPDEFLESVDLIAERLGLERIGWIFTHLPRKEYLTSDEVVHIAKLQLANMKKNMHYTNYSVSNFITCTISPDPLLSNEPVTNAFMVSDLGMALIRDNFIEENQMDPSHIHLRNPNKNELLPQILESGKETNKFDTDWFIVRVNESAPKVVRSIFRNFHFPRENRVNLQTANDIKEYFTSKKLDRGNNGNFKCSDFHLILFVSKVLDIETALALCDATLGKKEIDPIMEEVLTSIKI
ncbi:nuclear protein localization protein 4, putative [Plasmodium gallinaceum]|uniref:Nuclear protein localization protein 4, putative n=1 Tax=Plasmodium gallinaceum TaxID=5849 RepID=A0A1J1GZ62_PLAGA|nr:nuclear protein localization protein 4, putative [Plasmodium gallinaceum]CRG97853.1 nuclear protein localization protein 4, putative [Plasmodium gallinaceum]